jgi:hypothetical protein
MATKKKKKKEKLPNGYHMPEAPTMNFRVERTSPKKTLVNNKKKKKTTTRRNLHDDGSTL